MPDRLIIWINAGNPYSYKILDAASDAELDCGHQRPDDAVKSRS
jgi:hypothetical protein